MGIGVNYILNYRYTFDSDQDHHVVIPKFLTVMVVGIVINAAVMYTGTYWLGLHYMLAQLAAVVVVLMLSFTANRFLGICRLSSEQNKLKSRAADGTENLSIDAPDRGRTLVVRSKA